MIAQFPRPEVLNQRVCAGNEFPQFRRPGVTRQVDAVIGAGWQPGLPDGFDPADAGLGLSIVQSLVTGDLRGTFAITAEPHHGTTVTIGVPQPGAGA